MEIETNLEAVAASRWLTRVTLKMRALESMYEDMKEDRRVYPEADLGTAETEISGAIQALDIKISEVSAALTRWDESQGLSDDRADYFAHMRRVV